MTYPTTPKRTLKDRWQHRSKWLRIPRWARWLWLGPVWPWLWRSWGWGYYGWNPDTLPHTRFNSNRQAIKAYCKENPVNGRPMSRKQAKNIFRTSKMWNLERAKQIKAHQEAARQGRAAVRRMEGESRADFKQRAAAQAAASQDIPTGEPMGKS